MFQPATLVDDAYIHFRNALNWANGEGLVFNPGEWVLGTTAPVWALLLGIFHRVTGADIPRIATILNLLCDCGTMLLAMRWFERCGIPLLFRHGLVLVLTLEPLRMYYSVGGMEMSLFIVSLMGIMELARGEQGKLAGILLGMIGWIRPEGAILWIAIPVALVIAKKKKLAGNMLFVAVGVAAAAALLQIHAFGTFIPQSLRAKSTAPWYREAGGLCHVWFLIKLGDLTPFYPLNGFEAGWVSAADRINALAMASAQIALMAIGTLFMVRKGEGFAGWAMSLFAVGEYIFY
ncbi:hypothetical protein HY256_01835, partial [Candidatus Sumerlaeota bacterium]|nr:hypothetical protein [Candidatus Sumerlaeota bacterium]